jgi:phosphonate transport system substrate-binding protein
LSLSADVRAQDPKVVQVGTAKSLFRDVAIDKAKELTTQFGKLMEKHTGLTGEVSTSTDAFTLAEQLDKGKIDLGLFQGVEFAWVQHKFPLLKPLMLAVNEKVYVSVHLVTKASSKIARFEDLKGKQVSLPARSGGASHVFVERHSAKSGGKPDTFFAKIVKHDSVEDGLDDVARGMVDAAVVDSVMLESYAIVKPGVMALLRTIEKSPPFPASVVAYRQGILKQQTVDTFRTGMLNANKDPNSKGLMTLWRLTAFEPVPPDYSQALDTIREAYPPPAAAKTGDSAPVPSKR